MRIIIPRPKPCELGVLIVDASRKTKRLETRVGVDGNATSHIIVYSLGYAAVSNIDDESWAAEVAGDDAVGVAAFDPVSGTLAFAP